MLRSCRKCGGAFLAKAMQKKALPEILYTEPVWVCNPCATGKKHSSRWITKVPMKQRGTKEKGAGDQLADSVVEGAAKAFNSIGKFFSGD
jgi:hypothetical protein